MRRFLLTLLLLGPFVSWASHIVGGELALVHIPGTLYRYRIEMILYYDKEHGKTGGDLSARVRLFRKRDNSTVRTITLLPEGPIDRSDEQNQFAIGVPVEYYQPECSQGSIQTNRVFYKSEEFTMSPEVFSDEMGYYMAYERCCRNYSIVNIYSVEGKDQNGDGVADNVGDYNRMAGQIFYLEFPPVTKNGEPFINSSPKLFPPLSDYACPGHPYFVDFAGTDDDGDSLVYSIVTPLNSIERLRALPRGGPNAGPYDSITWRPGFSNENFMNGNPDLAISTEGMLTVTPKTTGLFVFAVRCSEYRNGIKIGEVRRDFQMLVSKFCATAVPPVIVARKLGETNFTYRDKMVLNFPPAIPDSERCIEVNITDQDILNDFDNFIEKIKIRVRALGDKRNVNEVILPAIKSATLSAANPAATFKICFDECPIQPNIPYQVEILAQDDACALPLLDTLRLTVTVQTLPNTPARFIAPAHDITDALNEGDPKKLWPVKVVDDDNDVLTINYLTDGFNLSDVGMDFDFQQLIPGLVEDTLSWDPKCDKYDFSVKRNFNLTLVADDNDRCSYNPADTVHVNLALIPPPNADPVIDTDLSPVFSERFADAGIHRIYDETIEFNIFGTDGDPFPIQLKAEGIDFKLSDCAMEFTQVSDKSPIQSPFKWILSCSQFDLAKRDTFAVRFMAIDKNNKCKIYQADTVEVAFKILPPLNPKPQLTIENLHPETTTAINELKTFWDKPIELKVTATDVQAGPVPDNVTIELVDIKSSNDSEPDAYTFAPAVPVTAVSTVQTKFSWQPNCSIFKNNVFDNEYTFTFRAFDDHCESSTADTLAVKLNIVDYISTDENFLPPNVITPNGDGLNDFFGLDGFELRDNGSDPDHEINLPLDNCINQFVNIKIFNRWGKLVFTSTNRYFKWYAPEAAAGVYYYLIKFSHHEYKSSISVRY